MDIYAWVAQIRFEKSFSKHLKEEYDIILEFQLLGK